MDHDGLDFIIHESHVRVVATGPNVDAIRLKPKSLIGVGWNGGYCKSCSTCRKGDFAGCVTDQYSGFTLDGGTEAVIRIPEEALKTSSYAELAPLLCGDTTVYGAIRSSNWNPGDIAVVQGIGGLGHLAIQYASKLGLKDYVVFFGSSKAEIARSLGEAAHIDSSTTNIVEYFQALGDARLIICTAPYPKQISSIIPAVGRNGMVTLVSAAVTAISKFRTCY